MIVTFYKGKFILLGLVIVLSLVILSMIKNIPEIMNAENHTAFLSKRWMDQINEKYPKEKFAIYDLRLIYRDKSVPLVLFLQTQKRIDNDGVKLGLFIATSGAKIEHPIIIGDRGGYQILNLSSSTSAELDSAGWAFVNPSVIYSSIEEWNTGK